MNENKANASFLLCHIFFIFLSFYLVVLVIHSCFSRYSFSPSAPVQIQSILSVSWELFHDCSPVLDYEVLFQGLSGEELLTKLV